MTECDCEVCRAAREARAKAIPAPQGAFAALRTASNALTAAVAAAVYDLLAPVLDLITRIFNPRHRR